jgi:cyanophycinase
VHTHLIGGGWDETAISAAYRPFLADTAGNLPTVAVLLIDEGDGAEDFRRYETALRKAGPCSPVPLLVPLGGRLDLERLEEADALLVGGGLTPAYQDALAPVAHELTGLLAARRMPYAGFSAGAAVAARGALVGGWLSGAVPVCSEDTAEDLEEIEVRSGLGLVEWTIDVHAAQWGTLPRLIEAVALGRTPHGVGVAIDENTLLTVDGDRARVSGLGRVHVVRAVEACGTGTVEVRAYHRGQAFKLSSGSEAGAS